MVDCQTVTYLLVVCPQTPSPSYSTCIPAPPGIIILICLFLGSHLDWPYCSTNSSFPSAPIPGFCFQPPTNPASHSASFYVIIYRALIPFMLFPSFPEEDLPQLITAHCSVTPKSVPGNTNASTSSYKNTKERKGKNGFHGKTVCNMLHTLIPIGRFTIYIRMLWALGIPWYKEKCLALFNSSFHFYTKHRLTQSGIPLLLIKLWPHHWFAVPGAVVQCEVSPP